MSARVPTHKNFTMKDLLMVIISKVFIDLTPDILCTLEEFGFGSLSRGCRKDLAEYFIGPKDPLVIYDSNKDT